MSARKVLVPLDLSSQQIHHLADGSASDDAATFGQVQSLQAGLAWKDSVRAASTANVTVSSAPSTLDGVTLANGDRVLLKNQTTGAENGIYVFASAGAALTRATDMDTAAETKAATTLVREGTANSDTAWTQTADAVTLGTTALTFAQFGGGTAYSADSTGGLQLVGSAFSAKLPASSGLVKDATGLYVDKALVMSRFAVDVGDGSSTAITVTHSLGTRDVTVTLYDKSTNAEVQTDVVHTSTTVVTLNFATAPASNAYRCVVIG